MKNTLLFALLLSSHVAFSQKIESVEIDKFTGKKRIETEYTKLVFEWTGANMKFRTVDSTLFFIIQGTWGSGVVGPSDPMTFLLDDKTTFNIYPTSIQSYEIQTGKFVYNTYSQQYYISKNDLIKLSNTLILSVRRTYNSHYIDADVKTKHAKKIKELAQLVLNELNK